VKRGCVSDLFDLLDRWAPNCKSEHEYYIVSQKNNNDVARYNFNAH